MCANMSSAARRPKLLDRVSEAAMPRHLRTDQTFYEARNVTRCIVTKNKFFKKQFRQGRVFSSPSIENYPKRLT